MPAPVGIKLDTLPTRSRVSAEELAEARQWLAVIESEGGASDGETYEDMAAARKVAQGLARRIAIVSNGRDIAVRTFGVDAEGTGTSDPEAIAGYGFVVSLRKPADNGKSKSK